ncbi:CocE/NonD family hydrolase [Halalkalicoccus ordinarius]|uniref:CocE/NonD family hydrolase n=1 Tax=Halalkalicoccus ordinarius TaxID=3116651 RepID=UPI00300EC087
MTDVAVPGARDVRATLDGEEAESIVVACPPHPRQRGHRGDPRLTAVGGALSDEGVACLRFDYGEWDEGYGEREDARNAIRWTAERYDRVGVFGYSFGAAVALLAAASVEEPLGGVSVLAPAASLGDGDLDAAGAVAELDAPLQVLYGARDTTVDWRPVVEAAREAGARVEELPADHFFLGKHDRIAASVAEFFAERF